MSASPVFGDLFDPPKLQTFRISLVTSPKVPRYTPLFILLICSPTLTCNASDVCLTYYRLLLHSSIYTTPIVTHVRRFFIWYCLCVTDELKSFIFLILFLACLQVAHLVPSYHKEMELYDKWIVGDLEVLNPRCDHTSRLASVWLQCSQTEYCNPLPSWIHWWLP